MWRDPNMARLHTGKHGPDRRRLRRRARRDEHKLRMLIPAGNTTPGSPPRDPFHAPRHGKLEYRRACKSRGGCATTRGVLQTTAMEERTSQNCKIACVLTLDGRSFCGGPTASSLRIRPRLSAARRGPPPLVAELRSHSIPSDVPAPAPLPPPFPARSPTRSTTKEATSLALSTFPPNTGEAEATNGLPFPTAVALSPKAGLRPPQFLLACASYPQSAETGPTATGLLASPPGESTLVASTGDIPMVALRATRHLKPSKCSRKLPSKPHGHAQNGRCLLKAVSALGSFPTEGLPPLALPPMAQAPLALSKEAAKPPRPAPAPRFACEPPPPATPWLPATAAIMRSAASASPSGPRLAPVGCPAGGGGGTRAPTRDGDRLGARSEQTA